jgi:AcrR family transcriptional regulator
VVCVPRISEATRARRREHILVSAWGCFSGNGFHATSMDDIIAATGMSSSAVYRYFRSKDELIDATADEGLAMVGDIFTRLLAMDPVPGPVDVLTVIVDEVRRRTENPEYDLTRIAIQTWAEALRRPSLHDRAGKLYRETRERLCKLAVKWQEVGYLAPAVDPDAAAATVFVLMHGLIVCHHVADDVPADVLARGLAALGTGLDGAKHPRPAVFSMVPPAGPGEPRR